jgi:lipid A disaccharide synthetase
MFRIFFTLIYLPEILLSLLPMFLFAISLLSSVEVILVYLILIFIVIAAARIDLEFPKFKDGDRISIIIAPEESSSRSANRYIRTASKLKEYCDFQYVVFGTNSIVKRTNIHSTYDTSNITFWGVPNLQEALRAFFLYYSIARFILRNEKHIKNVIVYSSPDLSYRLFRYLHKRLDTKIRFIATGMPEKEVITGVPGKQTVSLIKNSHRLILPISGGGFTDFYDNLKSLGYWDPKKFFECRSALVIDYLKNTKNVHINLNDNKEILLLIGSRGSEISRHLSVAKYTLNKFENTEFRVFFLAPNEDVHEYLKGLFGDYKCAGFDLDEKHDYSLARLVICKSGTALIKPVLFGIPTIPFYIPSFRTKLTVKLVNYQLRKRTHNALHKPYFLLPNLITKSDFLVDEFLGSVDLNRLGNTIDGFIENPPDTEKFRVSFAREFLGVDGNIQGFTSVVEEYLKESTKNLKIIEQSILEDSYIDRKICPNPRGLLNKLKEKIPDDEPLSAFAIWRYCGRDEDQTIDAFRTMKLGIKDSTAIAIASNLIQTT